MSKVLYLPNNVYISPKQISGPYFQSLVLGFGHGHGLCHESSSLGLGLETVNFHCYY